MKLLAHLEFDGSNLSKKMLQGQVYNGLASPILLRKVCICLGTEETSCWTFVRNLVPFLSDKGFWLLNSSGSSLLYFVVSAKCFLLLKSLCCPHFPQVFFPLFFLEVLLTSYSRHVHIFYEIVKCLTFSIWYVSYALLWIKKKFGLWDEQIIAFVPTFFGVGVLNWI